MAGCRAEQTAPRQWPEDYGTLSIFYFPFVALNDFRMSLHEPVLKFLEPKTDGTEAIPHTHHEALIALCVYIGVHVCVGTCMYMLFLRWGLSMA